MYLRFEGYIGKISFSQIGQTGKTGQTSSIGWTLIQPVY